MEKPIFEELLRRNEEGLHRIRTVYFPLIRGGVITGYNIYPKPSLTDEGLCLHYLHSDLKPKDRHLRELIDKLKMKGGVDLEERITVNDQLFDRTEIIERNADYRTRPSWKDPVKMRYFSFEGRELSAREIKLNRRGVIGESVQYDLLIRVRDISELRKLVDLFKKYTSKDKLDRKGSKIKYEGRRVKNPDAILESWSIPLLICRSDTNQKPRNLRDFVSVAQFCIKETLGDKPVVISSLSGSKKKLFRRFLEEGGISFVADKRYVLRVFVDECNP